MNRQLALPYKSVCRYAITICAATFLLLLQPVQPKTALADSLFQPPVAPAFQLTVYRSPTCGCCKDWVAHMRSAGFQIDDNVTLEMETVRPTYGVPEELSSCHTAIANGYVIEGHVPAADVQRLLTEQPNVIGLTAPGMPTGSPGMEVNRSDPYTVFTFTSDTATPFAIHNS